jgi:hypothetical protein
MCIIHWISRNIIQTECSLVLKKLEYLLSFFGGFLGSNDNNNGGNDKKGGAVDEEEGEEDEEEPKKRKKTNSYNPFDNEMKLNLKKEKEIFSSLTSSSSTASTSASAASSAHQLFYQLIAYQCQLRAEELLIRLKSYLKEEYALTDEMCKDYESNPERSTSSATYDQRETDFSLSLKDVLDIEMLYSEEHLKLLLVNQQTPGLSSVSLSSTGNSKKKKSGSSAANDNTIDSSVVTISKEEIFHSLLSQCVYDFNRVTALLEKEGDDFKLESQFGLSVANKRKKRATPSKKVLTEGGDVSGPSVANSGKKGGKGGSAAKGKGVVANKAKGKKRPRYADDEDVEDEAEEGDDDDDGDEEFERMLEEMDRGGESEEENEKKSRKKTKSISSISAGSTKPVSEGRTPST